MSNANVTQTADEDLSTIGLKNSETFRLSFFDSVEEFDNIKIMPCVEGDRSDCQPEESSIARSRSGGCRGLTI